MMARPRDKVRSTRVWIDGNRKRGVDARQDRTFAWLDAIPSGKRFDFVWDLLTAALNGEMGAMMQEAVEDGDVDKARAAAMTVIGNFVVDDDDPPAFGIPPNSGSAPEFGGREVEMILTDENKV